MLIAQEDTKRNSRVLVMRRLPQSASERLFGSADMTRFLLLISRDVPKHSRVHYTPSTSGKILGSADSPNNVHVPGKACTGLFRRNIPVRRHCIMVTGPQTRSRMISARQSK